MSGVKLFTNLSLLNKSQSVRTLATSWNPKWRPLRAKKIIKPPNLPEYEKIFNEQSATSEERRSYQIKNGIQPPVSFEYKPLNITSSGEIFDPYVPPEGDGRRTIISKEGLTQVYDRVKSKGTQWRHIKKIASYENNFDLTVFADQALHIFINAHEALQNRDSERLIEYVTETCYPKIWNNSIYKTIRWKWIEAIEVPTAVHAVTKELLSKKHIFGQITLRLHSKQTLAIYDRFGRLAYGSETLEKNVLEYLVFEKNLTNQYGKWRLLDKIVPEWSEEKMPIVNSYRKVKHYKMLNEDVEPEESKFKSDDSHLDDITATESEQKPAATKNV